MLPNYMKVFQKYISAFLIFVCTALISAMDQEKPQGLNMQLIVAEQAQAEKYTQKNVLKKQHQDLVDLLQEGLIRENVITLLGGYARPSLVFSGDRALIPWIIVKQRSAIVESVQSDDYQGLKKAGRLLDFYNFLFDVKIPNSFTFIKNYREPMHEEVSLKKCQESKVPLFFRWDSWPFNHILKKKNKGRVLLHMTNDCKIIQTLLKIGVDVNAESNKITPLYVVSLRCNCQAAELLINQGAHIDVQDYQQQTPLCYVILAREDDVSIDSKIKLIKLLLDRGANVNSGSQDWQTPLYLAVESQDVHVAKLLLDRGANVNFEYSAPQGLLYQAIIRGDLEMTKLLLDRGVKRSWRNQYNENKCVDNYLLGCLIVGHSENIELIQLLLDDGAELDLEMSKFNEFIDEISICDNFLDGSIDDLHEKIQHTKILSFEEFTNNVKVRDLIAQARIGRAQVANNKRLSCESSSDVGSESKKPRLDDNENH